MLKSDPNIQINQPGKLYLTCCLLIFAAAVFIIPNCIGQSTSEQAPSDMQSLYSEYIREEMFNLNSLDRPGFNQAFAVSANRVSDKETTLYTARLDSVYELADSGIYYEAFHCHYHYNGLQPDSMWRYYYNADGKFEYITEISNYNAAGQILKLIRKEPNFPYYYYSGVLIFSEVYDEVYQYQDGNLIRESLILNDEYRGSVTNEYYTYDAENKLIHRSVKYSTSSALDETDYVYNPDNDLEYMFIQKSEKGSDDIHYNLTEKYEYEQTDSTRQITRNLLYSHDIKPIPDTITQWQYTDKFFETYDKKARRTSTMLIHEKVLLDTPWIDYKAEFTWTESNKLLHASYFRWQGTMDSGVWNETMRIDNTYDGADNLLTYVKTTYNVGTSQWKITESKTFYYTSVPVGLTENTAEPAPLCIFPNPAKNEITIRNLDGETSNYTIYNLYGQPLISGRLENQAIAVSQLKPGIYIIEIHDDQSVYSGKFVKY